MADRIRRFLQYINFEHLLYIVIFLSMLLFILYPFACVLQESLSAEPADIYLTYKEIFCNSGDLLWNSFFSAALATIGSVFVGFCVAVFVTRLNSCFSSVVMGMMFLTTVSPPFVSSLAYIMLVGKRGILTNDLLGIAWNPYGWYGVVMMQVLGYGAIAALLIIVTMKNIDTTLESASRDLGASAGQTFWRVTLPLAGQGIIAAALIVFVKALSDFGTPMIIGGNFRTLASEAYISVIGSYDMPRAAAINVILLLPSLLVYFIYRSVTKEKGGRRGSDGKSSAQGVSMVLPRGIRTFVAVVVAGYVCFELLKYSMLFWGMFCKAWGVDYGFTWDNIMQMNNGKWLSLWRSVEYSLAAAFGGSILALLISYLTSFRSYVGCAAMDFLATMPYMLPGTFFGIGYLLAFHDFPAAFVSGGSIIVVNCIFRQLPLGTKAGNAALSQINPLQESSARDLGAGKIRVLRDIIFPQMKTAMMISFANTFTAAMTAIGAIIFLITPASKVATAEMFSSIKTGNIGEGTVIANAIIIVVLLVNYLVYRLLQTNKIRGEK